MEGLLGRALVDQVEEALSKPPYSLVFNLAGGWPTDGASVLIGRQVMKRWPPDKVTAFILVCGCLALIASGKDSEVKSILGIAAVYLFGTALAERRAARKKEKEVE